MIAAPHELPKLTERRFQQQVVKYAELMGWRVYHDAATNQRARCRKCRAKLACAECGTPVTVVRNASGMPDLLLVRRPRVIWAELKADRGAVTPSQRTMIDDLRACGQEVYIWRPIHWEYIEKCLR